MNWTLRWLIAYCFTQLVEMGVYVHAPGLVPGPVSGPGQRKPRPIGERLAIAFGASGITHPLVWFAIPDACYAVGLSNWWAIVAIAECFALLSEALWLWAFGVRWALGWSLLANGTSYLVGLFCYEYLDW